MSLKRKAIPYLEWSKTTNSIPLTDFDTQQYEDICIVMGNEVTGIDEDILSHIDQFIMIPQFGQKHSLNVSVAAAVMLYALLEKMSH